jgi:hypothetical protein
MAGAVLFQT